jgi:hypothetical protein
MTLNIIHEITQDEPYKQPQGFLNQQRPSSITLGPTCFNDGFPTMEGNITMTIGTPTNRTILGKTSTPRKILLGIAWVIRTKMVLVTSFPFLLIKVPFPHILTATIDTKGSGQRVVLTSLNFNSFS